MISTKLIGNRWKDIRSHQRDKFAIYDWIEKFETELKEVSTQLIVDTSVGYFPTQHNIQPLIEYTENTPIPYLFKMSPKRYFLNSFNPRLWNTHDIDSTIQSKFMNANKYALDNNVYDFHSSYILFVLQSINFTPLSMSKKLLVELVYWAETNKKYVLFKLHPFTSQDNKLIVYWNMLKNAGVIKKYAVLVESTYNTDNLISNADAVWTHSSGVGLNAVVLGKPVVSFTDKIDYADIYTVCNSPIEAISAKNKPKSDIDRFLSWYYHKLVIDVSRDDLNEQITTRILSCVENSYNIERIFQ